MSERARHPRVRGAEALPEALEARQQRGGGGRRGRAHERALRVSPDGLKKVFGLAMCALSCFSSVRVVLGSALAVRLFFVRVPCKCGICTGARRELMDYYVCALRS